MHWSPTRTSADTIRRFAELVGGRGDPEAIAKAWTAAGFDDEQTALWLEARCFEPVAARALCDLDVTPGQARKRTRDGRGGELDTIGHKVANGDLSARQGAARAASSR